MTVSHRCSQESMTRRGEAQGIAIEVSLSKWLLVEKLGLSIYLSNRTLHIKTDCSSRTTLEPFLDLTGGW